MVQLAFHLADKYRNPVVVVSDAITGRMKETVEVEAIDFGPLPDKEDWAAMGKARHKDGKRHFIEHSAGFSPRYPSYQAFLRRLDQKIKQMQESEVRYESYKADDAKIILVAYGYTARVSKEAVNMASAEGIKAGLIRLQTAWPFPYEAIREKAHQGCRFLVVEDSLGQLVEDVQCAVEGCTEVQLVSILDRHLPTDGGMILPAKVIEKIKAM